MEALDALPPFSLAIRRSYLPGVEYLLMEGDFRPLFAGFDDWVQRYELPRPTGPAADLVHGMLAAVSLWLTFQPDDSMVAWTLALPDPGWRLFVAADAGDRNAIARWSPYGRDGGPAHPLFEAQLRRRAGPVQRSTIDPSRHDVYGLIGEFFSRSHQNPGRLFFDPIESFAQLLVAVADHDLAWLAELSEVRDGSLIPEERLPERRKLHEPQVLTYGCGCSPERIRQVVLAAAGGNVPAVFGNDATAEVDCPRCGREHVLRRP